MSSYGQGKAISRRLAATKNAVVTGSYKVPTGLGESNKTSATAGTQSTGSEFEGHLAAEKARRRADRSAQQSS